MEGILAGRYLRWICGFANAEGGVLAIVADVRLVKKAGKELIEIRVESYPTPISYKGKYHYRSGSTKQELKGVALQRFLLRKQGRHWDDAPVPGFHVKDCS